MGNQLQVGVVIPVELGWSSDPASVLQFVRAAEALGFDEVSAVEHSVVVRDTESTYPYSPTGEYPMPLECDIPDPLELLSFLAAATSHIRLATGVLVISNHNPVVLAKRLATLDKLSGGRTRICLGLGWMREEIEASGGVFTERGKRADEAIEVMRALWAGGADAGTNFRGPFTTLTNAHSWPKPLRDGAVPLYVGGHSLAAARRAGRLGDGFQPLGLGGEKLQNAIAVMRAAAADAGRDPAEVGLVLGHMVNRVEPKHLDRAAGQGADTMLLSISGAPAADPANSLALAIEELEGCADRLGLGH